MSAENFPTIRRKLLRRYDRNKRDLPWRRTRDPYAIWISETMLQQTQVKTVLRYFNKFLQAFPSIADLDRAPLARVLQAWSGLGYYRRAENLKKAARQLMRAHGGQLPQEYRALRNLAGIGDYTAGAILSIAFQQRFAAVDGNVRRVLGRLFGLRSEKKIVASAGALVPRARPGDFNQALMDLGATICPPKKPRCEQCPLASECAARASHLENRPFAQRYRRRFKDVTWPLAIVRQRGKILLRQRASGGLLARLWELPGGEIGRRGDALGRLRQDLRKIIPARKPRRPIGEIRHHITDRRIRAPIFLFDCPSLAALRLPDQHWRWVDPVHLSRYAASSMTAKALKAMIDYEARAR